MNSGPTGSWGRASMLSAWRLRSMVPMRTGPESTHDHRLRMITAPRERRGRRTTTAPRAPSGRLTTTALRAPSGRLTITAVRARSGRLTTTAPRAPLTTVARRVRALASGASKVIIPRVVTTPRAASRGRRWQPPQGRPTSNRNGSPINFGGGQLSNRNPGRLKSESAERASTGTGMPVGFIAFAFCSGDAAL
jgi:hypothetical protein